MSKLKRQTKNSPTEFVYQWGETTPEYIAYTDGACATRSDNGEGGSAYVILKDNNIVRQASKGFMHTTNNRMEMLAVISALNCTPVGSKVEIRTDSQYCIYSAYSKNLTKNLDLVYKMRELIFQRRVHMVWVKGHNGDLFNELCDSLAEMEVQRLKQLRPA